MFSFKIIIKSMQKDLKEKYFRLVEKFTEYHRRYRYPLIFNYSVVKIVLRSLRAVAENVKKEFKEKFTGLLLRGSHCRAYSSLNEDVDLILVHNLERKPDIIELINFFKKELRNKNLKLCDQGLEHFYKNAVYKTLYERKNANDKFFRRDYDIKLLFTGVPVFNKFEIIRLRRDYLLRAVSSEEERMEWKKIVTIYKKSRNFMAKKAAIKLFSRISKIYDFDDDPFSFYEIDNNLRYLIYEAEKKIRECFENRETNYFIEPERELERINSWFKIKSFDIKQNLAL